jgi:hypothetical protein
MVENSTPSRLFCTDLAPLYAYYDSEGEENKTAVLLLKMPVSSLPPDSEEDDERDLFLRRIGTLRSSETLTSG